MGALPAAATIGPGVTVSSLAMTAVKGFGLQHPPSIVLTAGGALGNRDFLVVDRDDELLSVTRSGAFLPYWSEFDHREEVLRVGQGSQTCLSGRVALAGPVRAHLFGDRYVDGHLVTGPWGDFLTRLVGEPVRLLRTAEPAGGYDVHPVTLMSEASVAALGAESDGQPLDRRRFRLLITCDGVAAFDEDGWAGTELAVGSARIRMGGPVPRCAAIQRHPDDPGRKVDALRRIARLRGAQPSESGRTLNLGVYAEVTSPGLVSVGDPLVPVQPE